MSVNVSMYNRMNSSKLGEFKQISIKPFIPEPSDSDYKRGYITRHFVQKVNDENSTIYEITGFNSNRITMNSFYLTTKLNWRISGTKEQIKDSNSKSVKLTSKDMPKLMMYLPNYLQFSK